MTQMQKEKKGGIIILHLKQTSIHIIVGTSHKCSPTLTHMFTNTHMDANTHTCSSALTQMLHKPNTHTVQTHINAHATAPQQSHTCSPTPQNAHRHMHTCQTVNTRATASKHSRTGSPTYITTPTSAHQHSEKCLPRQRVLSNSTH